MGYCQGVLGVTDSNVCSSNGGQWLADPSTGTPSNNGSGSGSSGGNFQNWLNQNGGFGNVANAINGGLSSLFSFGLGVGQLVNGQPVTNYPGQLPGAQNQNNQYKPNTTTASNTAMYVMIAIVIVLIVLAALYLFKQSKALPA